MNVRLGTKVRDTHASRSIPSPLQRLPGPPSSCNPPKPARTHWGVWKVSRMREERETKREKGVVGDYLASNKNNNNKVQEQHVANDKNNNNKN